MRKIDISTWSRREAYELFSGYGCPFYDITTLIDVTDLKVYSKRTGLSFYHLMVWLCAKAANSVPAFNMRIRGEDVWQLDLTEPSFTHIRDNSDAFISVYTPWKDDPAEFCREARHRADTQTTLFGDKEDTDEMLFISCVPWFDFTSASNPSRLDKDECIPRFVFGKYYTDGDRLKMHLSITVNHRVVDGFHVGQFVMALERELAALAAG